MDFGAVRHPGLRFPTICGRVVHSCTRLWSIHAHGCVLVSCVLQLIVAIGGIGPSTLSSCSNKCHLTHRTGNLSSILTSSTSHPPAVCEHVSLTCLTLQPCPHPCQALCSGIDQEGHPQIAKLQSPLQFQQQDTVRPSKRIYCAETRSHCIDILEDSFIQSIIYSSDYKNYCTTQQL